MSKSKLYPLKFIPIYKEKIWGGTKVQEYKGVTLDTSMVGESWEISSMEEDVSVVSEGNLKGKNINDLIQVYGSELLGDSVFKKYGSSFPLLVKVIYAGDDLSIQVHPDDSFAQTKHQSKGKTEMWYILETEPGAFICKGWNKDISPDKLKEILKTDSLISYLNKYEVNPGDAFYLPAGKVHTIGRGCLLLEIQEASDITYRLYDYNRKDSKGNLRDLHIDDAIEVLDYSAEAFAPSHIDSKNKLPILSEYFRIEVLHFQGMTLLPVKGRDSFTILFCISGKISIKTDAGNTDLHQGETLLIPASIEECILTPDGRASIIECFVPCY
ncbi:type I phosphomannose isomerase catalytic subunit [Porphyromonas sp.]|uniref:type I phosphomannose isomerase catalytic subunit n=1 Tax=Porphyromonas sp. TaxID=1924944 RepID=UPI0026DCE002|nr:type I phosphomannose isomerase catalytic subunit [Porphyromonas sp.]MDO4695672.1 class I mannose-6-phosphate isomerase [Porphyromonas sp.]MDO4771659.1 class I mannose-6-phosphate isomerase [Porphyromonas sp.]